MTIAVFGMMTPKNESKNKNKDNTMKHIKFIVTLAVLWCIGATSSHAQEFRLLMSRSIMEMPDYKKATAINKITDWIEVSDGGIYTNFMEVNDFLQKMKTPGLKGLEEANQFRRMRDRTILTFKFDDNERYYSYNVVAKHGNITKKLTTSKYFFMNVPMSDEPVELTVSTIYAPENAIHIKCQSVPFGNDSLYVFQLDKVCQKVDDTFNLEVLMSDSTSENLPITNQKFQCVFSQTERYPTKAYLGVTGKKLELDISKWNPGVGLAASFNALALKKECNFTTHNAEFATFNWIGAGLFAQYDTLFLQVRNSKSQLIKDARINIQRIDYDQQPVNDVDVRYLGVDEKTGDHMILTKGYPAYIEVQANGYMPLLYHYTGAVDPVTKVLSKTGISDYVVMTEGDVNNNETVFFKKELRFLSKKEYYLNAKKKIWDADITVLDLVKEPVTETVFFTPNGGTEEMKMADGQLREKYVTLDLHYAVPKNAPLGEAGVVELDFKDSEGKGYAPHLSDDVIDANIYTGLAHSFVVSKYDLSECIPEGETAAVTLRNGDMNDKAFPLLCNFTYTQDEIEEKAEEETVAPGNELENENPKSKMDDALELRVPFNFNFKFGDKVKMSLAITLNYLKMEINWKLTLTLFDPEEEQGEKMERAQERNKTVNDYKVFKTSKNSTFNMIDGKADKDSELNEIFSQNIMSGMGWAFKFFASGKVPFKGWSAHAKTNFFDFVEELGGSMGYSIKYGLSSMGNLLRAKNMDAAATWADLIETFIHFGFKLDCYVGGEMGITTLRDGYSDQAEGRGIYLEALAYAILAAWLEAGLPTNPMINFAVGVRGGGKLGIYGKFVHSFGDNFGLGLKLTALALLQYYFNIDTFLGGYHKSGNFFDVGGSKLFPDDDTNPYHKDFPNWLPKSTSSRANSYKPLKTEVDADYGKVVLENVASDAYPDYLNEDMFVVNHLHDSQIYDDDGIDVVDIKSGEPTKISSDDYLAIRHNVSVSGDKKIIVYQQCDTIVKPESVTDDNVEKRSMQLSKNFNICANILQSDGTWKKHVVYQNEEANIKPVAAIQDDGKAAVFWQSGTFDESIAETDSIMRQYMDGYLLYSRFDGEKWSEPIRITRIFKNNTVGDYQAIMRNDTVLLAVQESRKIAEETPEEILRYYSIPENPYHSEYLDETLKVTNFSIKKVGDYNVIALTHEIDTCKYDVYVKTLKMSCTPTGKAATDVGLQNYSPIGARIVPAANASSLADFALMWMENTDRESKEDGNRESLGGHRRVINAARMSYTSDLLAATPITVGMESDDLVMLGFDGYLDDDRIKVLYTLTDPELAGGTVVVENEKYFSNSFNYDLMFDQRAAIDGVYIPLVLMVNNTGTSAIRGVTAHLNNQTIEVEDAFIPPFQTKYFILSYVMEDDFNGYISSKVDVEYENIFKSMFNSRRKVSNLRSTMTKVTTVNNVDTEMKVLSQSVDDKGNNTLVVEVVNNSKVKLRSDQSILVAVLDNPRLSEESLMTKMVKIPASEMRDYGTYQKLITTITVPSVKNDVQAVVAATVVPESAQSVAEMNIYREIDPNDSYQYVTLHESGTPTYIDGVRADLRADKQMRGKRIAFTYKENGIQVCGLNKGETIRLYDIDGKELFARKANGSEMFVPINRHAFFVLSANDESIKFLF